MYGKCSKKFKHYVLFHSKGTVNNFFQKADILLIHSLIEFWFRKQDFITLNFENSIVTLKRQLKKFLIVCVGIFFLILAQAKVVPASYLIKFSFH